MNARTTNVPYTQSASQRERAEMLTQDRLRAIAKPASGDPATLYPRLPAESPWAQPGPGVEAPLGYSVNALGKERSR
jgi:hypothetical protein